MICQLFRYGHEFCLNRTHATIHLHGHNVKTDSVRIIMADCVNPEALYSPLDCLLLIVPSRLYCPCSCSVLFPVALILVDGSGFLTPHVYVHTPIMVSSHVELPPVTAALLNSMFELRNDSKAIASIAISSGNIFNHYYKHLFSAELWQRNCIYWTLEVPSARQVSSVNEIIGCSAQSPRYVTFRWRPVVQKRNWQQMQSDFADAVFNAEIRLALTYCNIELSALNWFSESGERQV